MMPKFSPLLTLSMVVSGAALIGVTACGQTNQPVTVVEEDGDQNNGDDNNSSATNQSSNDQNQTNNANNAGNNDTNNGNNNGANNDTNNSTPNPGNDGSACDNDSDCMSGVCLNNSDWPNGYCTTVECQTFEDCQNINEDENRCLINQQGGTNFCVRICDPDGVDSCRDQYQCQALSGGLGWCAPTPGSSGGGGVVEPDGGGDFPFDVQCVDAPGQTVSFDYEIGPNTTSYMVVPITSNGQALWPLRIERPSGNTLSFQTTNAFQATGAQLFGYTNPTVVPAIEDLDYQLEAGTHTFTLNTDDNEVCYYVIENTGTPTEIDVNIYLVDIPGISASNAGSDPDLQQMIDRVDELYDQADISLGEIRYFDAPVEAAQEYSVIYNESDVSNLVSYSDDPGTSADDVVSANVFITSEFAMGGALGISMGIPGIVGVHGSGISGVALTGEYLGRSIQGTNGNLYTANIFAHELGHFLGLFHTSEQNGQTFDPVADTPECANMSNPTNCSDWGNLMFPMAASANTEITTGQRYMMHSNPLTK